MQNVVYELRRINLPRTWVNKGKLVNQLLLLPDFRVFISYSFVSATLNPLEEKSRSTRDEIDSGVPTHDRGDDGIPT